jgi:hypothetical protein
LQVAVAVLVLQVATRLAQYRVLVALAVMVWPQRLAVAVLLTVAVVVVGLQTTQPHHLRKRAVAEELVAV